MKKRFLALLMIFSIISGTALYYNNSNMVYADKIDDLKKEKKKEEESVQEKKKSIDEMAAEKDGLFAKIAAKKKQMEEIQDKIIQLQEKMAELSEAIQKSENNIKELQERIKKNEELFKKRIRVMYGNKDLNSVEVLFASSNIRDFISRYFLMQSIADYDKKLIASLKSDKEALVKEKETLEANRNEIAAEKKKWEVQNQQLVEETARHQALVKKLEASIEYSQSELEELEAKVRKLGANISFEERARAEALRSITDNKIQEEIKNGYVPQSSGEMAWPLPGHYYISSYFGWRASPMGNGTGMRHTGIDIPAPMGTPVYSASDGVVIKAEWDYTGYGNAVFIRYGDNVTVIYGHNSSLLVSAGERVVKGQIISRVGSTGYSTGPHLHFETRINNIPVNPTQFVNLN